MLVFDSASTYEMMIARKVTALLTGGDLGAYFDHVWICHPVASLPSPPDSAGRFGRRATYELAPRDAIIGGRIGRSAQLAWAPILNFVLAQIDLARMLRRLVREQGTADRKVATPLQFWKSRGRDPE